MAEGVIPLPIPSVQNAVLQVAIPVIKNSEGGYNDTFFSKFFNNY